MFVIDKQTKELFSSSYTELTVNNYQEEKMIHNVVAKLYGAVEPGMKAVRIKPQPPTSKYLVRFPRL